MGTISGTIKWFNEKKGFGFLEQQGGPDVFVMVQDVNSSQDKIKEGASASFEVTQGSIGPRALNVVIDS